MVVLQEEADMTRQLTCADVTGDCEAVVTGETDEEILEQAVPHAEEVHGLGNNEALRQTLQAAIKDA